MSFESVSGRLEGTWSDHKRWSVAVALLEGVSFLHSVGVVHRDIKERNYVIIQRSGTEWTIVLIDMAGAYVDEAALEEQARLESGALQLEWERLVLTHMDPFDTKHLPRRREEAGPASRWSRAKKRAQAQSMRNAVCRPGEPDVPLLNSCGGSKLGVVGGKGTGMRRGREPLLSMGEDAAVTRGKWEHFDRMALAIQVLLLAMSEDITRRMEPIGSVVEMPELDVRGGGKRQKGARKTRVDVRTWLEDHFLRWLDDPCAAGGSQSVPARWRGQRHLQRGLAGAWERTDGKVLDRSGKTVAVESWDTSALCAQAIGGLMAAKAHVNTSKQVIDASRELLRKAWPA
jgi:hypothetical protein